MEIEDFISSLRDLAIIAYVFFSTVILAVLLVIVVLLYRKILSLIDSVQKVTKDVGETTSELRGGLLKPLLKGGGAAFGVLQILKFLMGLKPKRSEKNND